MFASCRLLNFHKKRRYSPQSPWSRPWQQGQYHTVRRCVHRQEGVCYGLAGIGLPQIIQLQYRNKCFGSFIIIIRFLSRFTVSVHWCHFRQWSLLFNYKISCLCLISVSQVFDNRIWGITAQNVNLSANMLISQFFANVCVRISPEIQLHSGW